MMTMYHSIQNSALKNLSVDFCHLGDVGGVAIAEACQNGAPLKTLSMKENDLKDETAKAFAFSLLMRNCNLESLDLSNNLINDSGGELVAKSLQENNKLLRLNMSKNNMRDTSGAMFALSMRMNPVILTLNL